MNTKKLVNALTKDTIFTVNFQKHTGKKYLLFIGAVTTAYVASLGEYFLISKVGEKIDNRIEESKKADKKHLVAFDDTPKFKKAMEKKVDEKYEGKEKLNGILNLAAILAASVVIGKVIGHYFTKWMNDLDK